MSNPPLNALLAAYRGYAGADQDPAVAAVFRREAEALRRLDWPGRAAPVGAIAPDPAVPGPTGRPTPLSALLRQGPLVVKFHRGRWCPYCTLDLRAWQRVAAELQSLGATLVTVSPQTEAELALVRERDRLRLRMVSDADRAIARAFGVDYEVMPAVRELYRSAGIHLDRVNADAAWTLPLPAVFVIGPDRRIAWRHLDPDYRRRAEPGEVLAEIASLVLSASPSPASGTRHPAAHLP